MGSKERTGLSKYRVWKGFLLPGGVLSPTPSAFLSHQTSLLPPFAASKDLDELGLFLQVVNLSGISKANHLWCKHFSDKVRLSFFKKKLKRQAKASHCVWCFMTCAIKSKACVFFFFFKQPLICRRGMISELESVTVEMFSLFFSITIHLMPKQKQKVRLTNLSWKSSEVSQSHETPNF